MDNKLKEALLKGANGVADYLESNNHKDLFNDIEDLLLQQREECSKDTFNKIENIQKGYKTYSIQHTLLNVVKEKSALSSLNANILKP